MFVCAFVRSLGRKLLASGLIALLSIPLVAQDAPQQTANPQAAPAGKTTKQNPAQPMTQGAPPLAPLPQAPGPQNNAHPYSEFNFAKPQPAFPNLVAPYTTRNVPQANLGNSTMVDRLFHDGKIYLSINDAVALGIENNLDISLQRYNLSIADTDLLLTSSGMPSRGVNAGVVQGTLGGAIGGTSTGGTGTTSTGASGTGAGGTQVGVGGAGAGAQGLVLSTLGSGPPLDSYDPVLSANIQGEHALTPQTSTVFTGVPFLSQNTNLYNFTYTQGFSTGTLMTVTFDNSYITTNNIFALVTPQLTPAFRFQLRQHLLQGFGFDPNLRYIRIARNNREISDVVFRQQIITTVSQIENIYWDLVTAYEAVQVNDRALQYADRVLSDDQQQVKIGTMAPITLAQAQSGVATAKQNLIVSQTNLQLEELLMKNAITKNMDDPLLADAPVIPTDTLKPREQYQVRPLQDLIDEALEQRPEVAQARINLTNLEITRKSLRNALLPVLDVYAFYGASGLAGSQNPQIPTCPQVNDFGECYQPGLIPQGYGSSFQNLFNSSAPDKGIGVNLSIPIRNRAAQANQVRSALEYRQAQVALQQTENTIKLQVRQAQFAMQQNFAALQAAIAARDYAQQSLDAEEKKFTYGASTPTLVLQASSNLTQAESNVLNAAANYEKSRVNLEFTTAETLTKLGIDLGDAEGGKVKHMPKIPGVVPADVNNVLGPKQGTQAVPNMTTPPVETPPSEQNTPEEQAAPPEQTPAPAQQPPATPPQEQPHP